MAETETTPEEKPLHDVVLELMFQENKEKPAQVTAKDVFWKFTDETVSENNVVEVLKWLAHQKRVEYTNGKYSLDRFEFLDQRRLDNSVVGPDGKLKPAEFKKSDIPLHDVILNLMFEADKEKPVEFSTEDIFWKISDPSVLEGQVIEVLKWLLHHKRVDFRAGKYSLDRFEFLDQTKEEKKAAKVKKPKKTAKKVVAEEPKETKVSKSPKVPKPKEETKPVKTPKATPVSIPKKVEVKSVPEQKVKVISNESTKAVEKSSIVNNILLSLAAVLFAYTFYLLLFASSEMTTVTSSQVRDEIVSAELRLSELNKNKDISSNRIVIVEEKLDLIQEITSKNAQRLASQDMSSYDGLRSLIIRLLLSNTLILLIFGIVYYRRISTKSN